MRNALILLILLVYALGANNSKAATMTFTGACQQQPLYSFEVNVGESIGAETILSLKQVDEPFKATLSSLDEAFGLSSSGVYEFSSDDPTLNANQMRVYGWCYEVNGQVLPLLPSEYTIQKDDQINWFYGYVFYDSGNWGEMCQKASKLSPKFLCD